jgi:asparagine synthetase B (glutamine-hydrolysing)
MRMAFEWARRFLLGRDVCGNATLYFYEDKGFIAFASGLKAPLAVPGVPIEPDWLRLAEVLVSWQPDGELTAYKGFWRLSRAHAMIPMARPTDGVIGRRRVGNN